MTPFGGYKFYHLEAGTLLVHSVKRYEGLQLPSSLHDCWEICFAGDAVVKNSRVQAILYLCETSTTEGTTLIKIDSSAKRQTSFS